MFFAVLRLLPIILLEKKPQYSLQTRIAPTLLGLRQALKISIDGYLPKFHQIINVELFLNCYDALIFIAVGQ